MTFEFFTFLFTAIISESWTAGFLLHLGLDLVTVSFELFEAKLRLNGHLKAELNDHTVFPMSVMIIAVEFHRDDLGRLGLATRDKQGSTTASVMFTQPTFGIWILSRENRHQLTNMEQTMNYDCRLRHLTESTRNKKNPGEVSTNLEQRMIIDLEFERFALRKYCKFRRISENFSKSAWKKTNKNDHNFKELANF